jgi:hypothetical protein
MNVNVLCSAFAIAVVAVNWYSTTITTTAAHTTRIELDGAGLVVVCCIIALFFLTRSIYKRIRICLEEGIRISSSVRLLHLWPCLLLLPLLVHSSSSYTDNGPGGAIITHIRGFGSDQSAEALFLAALTIAAWQFSSGLSGWIHAASNAE